MKPHLAIGVVLAVLGMHASANAGKSDVDASLAIAKRYSEAFVDGDCITMEMLTANAVRKNLGGPEKLRDFLCNFLQLLRDDGARLSEDLLGPIGEFADGDTRFVLIQKRRISVRPDRRQVSIQPYIVHSNDAGATWFVLDLACADEKWLSKLAPTWKGVPPLPKLDFQVTRNDVQSTDR